jgi:hypothetical protein
MDKIEFINEMRMMRLILVFLLLSVVLSGCGGWTVRPIPYNVPPTTLASRTPSVHTATPVIIPATFTATQSGPSPTPLSSSITDTPIVDPTFTETPAGSTLVPTLVTVPPEALTVDLLGCDTSIDITHGMGEVTNAFLTISNLGTSELLNICATLRGQDEGQAHPDRTKCISSIPGGYQVTLKLTIDTTYKEASPIQVEIASDDLLLQRLAKDGCSDIGLFPPGIDDIGRVEKIP